MFRPESAHGARGSADRAARKPCNRDTTAWLIIIASLARVDFKSATLFFMASAHSGKSHAARDCSIRLLESDWSDHAPVAQWGCSTPTLDVELLTGELRS